MSQQLRSWPLAAALAVMAAGAVAGEGPPHAATAMNDTKSPAAAVTAGTADGVRVFIDPETGEIGDPTPEQKRALEREEELARSLRAAALPPLQPFALSQGGLGVRLDERHLHSFTVRRDTAGALAFSCAAEAVQAAAGEPSGGDAMAAPVSARPPPAADNPPTSEQPE